MTSDRPTGTRTFTLETVSPRDPRALALEVQMQAEYVRLYGTPDMDPDNAMADAERVLLLGVDGAPSGIIAWSRWENGDGKVRLLWVTPSQRGLRLAERLLEAAEVDMWDVGIVHVRFETGPKQPAAMRLYERNGYRRQEHGFGFYADNPGSVFYGKDLR